jgi:hypothetical protein
MARELHRNYLIYFIFIPSKMNDEFATSGGIFSMLANSTGPSQLSKMYKSAVVFIFNTAVTLRSGTT